MGDERGAGATEGIFLKGRKTILRPLRKSTDLAATWRWINDPAVRRYLKSVLPYSYEQEEQWFDQLSKRRESDIILAIESDEGRFIGTMGLHRIQWKDRVATTGTLIGEQAYWGKGYGTDAKMTLLDYAFNTLNLRKICSSVLEFNERSLRYSLRCGYVIEGRRRGQIFRDGRFWDEIMLGLFREEWEPIWTLYRETGEVRHPDSTATSAGGPNARG